MCKYLLDLIGLTLRRQLQLEDYYDSNYNNKTMLSIILLNLQICRDERKYPVLHILNVQKGQATLCMTHIFILFSVQKYLKC